MLQKFALATLAVAAALGILAGLSRLGTDATEVATPDRDATSAEALTPVHGQRPLTEIVDLWSSRADAQPLDYLSRTQLGAALATQARETADLDGYAEAEGVYRDALALNPDHSPARLGLAQTLLARHEFAAAAEEVADVLADRPDSLPALALWGDANLELGHYEEAAATFERLVAVERSAPTVSRLARLRFAQGRPDEALALAEEALELSDGLALRPNTQAFYWFQLGHYRFESGDVDGALEAHDRALALDAANPAANEARADVLAAAGRWDEADDAYARLAADGAAPDVLGRHADLLRLLGDEAGAAAQEEQALELAEDLEAQHPAERRHLIGFWVDRDPERAVELAQADLAARADVGAHDALAWALFKAGRAEEAAEAMDQALALDTQDADFLYHAGVIAAANDDTAAARRHLAAALDLNPRFHPTEADAARALLAELGGPVG